ncbi:MAG TPA: hypothetical protein DEO40_04485 [Treponema sp.]|jgi:small-conductance mechanosensitive channel|nr:hypothetical protein [Treponema sp.]HCA19911.1 hypothetical protein [Treponema sp.]
MYRVEIISNKSVEDDIVEALEQYVPGILYTTVPLAYGRGGDDYKLGTATWPETNFVMVTYVQEDQLEKIREVIKSVKEKFKSEGIKMFYTSADEL